jgi:serine/threonine-protein kinase
VTTADPKRGEIAHRWPEILPGGKAALFTILTGGSMNRARIALLSLETGDYRVLVEGGSFARYVPTGHLIFAKEGVLLAATFDLESFELGDPVVILKGVMTSGENGTANLSISQSGTLAYVPQATQQRALVWVERSGFVRPITETRRGFEDPRLSPDGQRLAVTIRENEIDIWVYEFSRDALVRMTFNGQNEVPVWTPDGSRLTFRSGSPINLFWQAADGSGVAEKLTTSDFVQTPTSWSPDGSTLVYHERHPDATLADIWFVSRASESAPRPFVQSPFVEQGGVFSPDGRFLAYASNESGRFEVYVRPFPDLGGKWQVSTEGGLQPLWSRSGREIFYRSGDSMMTVPVDIGSAFRVGKPVQLFEAKFAMPGSGVAEYDVATDDKRFVMLQDAQNPTEIRIVLNWFEELKERVPTHPR